MNREERRSKQTKRARARIKRILRAIESDAAVPAVDDCLLQWHDDGTVVIVRAGQETRTTVSDLRRFVAET